MKTKLAGGSKPTKLKQHPWSHYWPTVVAGAMLFMGIIVFVLLMEWLALPPKVADARLAVRMMLVTDQRTEVLTVRPRSNSLLEAVARLSAHQNEPTVYTTRGASAYLQKTCGLQQGQGGQWSVFVEGAPIDNLATAQLKNGDEVRLIWESQ